MKKIRLRHVLNWSLLFTLILSSCSGIPGIATATPVVPTPTSFQQSVQPAIIETNPPSDSVIGHLAPITFYFNQAMNKSTVESAFSGLPDGTFTWSDDATLVFTPSTPYAANSTLNVTVADSVQSATGVSLPEPIELTYSVADFLRTTNVLPKADATDANVGAAIVASFNQPVVALAADSTTQPPAFDIQPTIAGNGEWINTSTYIFYPDPPMAGGTEYTVSLDPNLMTVSGMGLDGGGQNTWKFVTARPRVVALNPSAENPIAPDAAITLTFNQPMDQAGVQSNFLFNGNEGPVSGTFTWNDDATELTFKPDSLLARGVGYLLNVNAGAKSRGGTTLGGDYGAVLNTYGDFAVTGTDPQYPWTTTFFFSTPVADAEYKDAVTITPAIDNLEVGVNVYDTGMSMYVNGIYLPDTDYTIELSGTIKDKWGEPLGEPYVLNVHTPPLAPALTFQSLSNAALVRPDDPVVSVNATNIQTADVAIEPMSLQDFFTLQSSFEALQAYQPKNASLYSQSFDLEPNKVQPVGLNLTEPDTPLPTGVYYLDVTSPQIPPAQGRAVTTVRAREADTSPTGGGGAGGIGVDFVVSSQVNLTFKRSAKEALVWAVDLTTRKPVIGATIVIYDGTGNSLGSGVTDSDGVWKGAINSSADSSLFAVLGAPGDPNFGLALSGWSFEFSAWNFGYSQIVEPPKTEIYLYTDRPIYRPGQTVYFRGVARQAFNGRYELPPINQIRLNVMGWDGTQVSAINATLSPYGTFNGQVELPPDAAPGYYSLQNESLNFYFGFQVAEYRKPEINLSMDFTKDEIKLGDSAAATVDAQYFFGAPAGGADVSWNIYYGPAYFYLPGYQTGLLRTSWWDSPSPEGLGANSTGTGRTSPEGTLSIELPAIPESEAGQIITFEATVQDESGFPVSAQKELLVHPANFYIGLKPDSWIGTSKTAMGFDVFTADWGKNPSGNQSLTAEFSQVQWDRKKDQFGFSRYTAVFTPLSSSNLATGPDGKARLSFIPPTAGTFMLDVSGGGTRTQVLIWVGGPGTAPWPELDNNRIQLTADQDSYNPGETASIFIPNPFTAASLALVTVERGIVFKSEVVALSGSGRQYSLPISEDDAPNVYVTATVLGQDNQFKYGMVNLPVSADALGLNVSVTPNPPQAGPREDVTFDVQVTDHDGQPVEGEFSLSVVDLAVLKLADPNSPDIFPAYYSIQPLGFETSISLAGLAQTDQAGGLGGGGGGGEVSILRENFPDTAYWNPSLITNSEGHGQVTMTLPDSLTTWQIDVRGLTVDTKVGQADTQIISTKPLLVRPATPRFLVAGDHALMAAVINNNTANRISASVSLQSEGFDLDEPARATQQVNIPANGRTRVEWWGTASMADSADLIFTAKANGNPALQDSTRPVLGKLPILRYTSPQAFVTGGALRGAATQQEVISLPRTFSSASGGLEVELSPSLAGTLTSALEAMPKPDENSAEAIVSYLTPNVEVYRALSAAGLNDPKLVDRVEADLNSSVSRLFYLQNSDGGWNWWGRAPLFNAGTDVKSDPYVSAYVFFGLLRAREAGASMNEDALQRAGAFLRDANPAITADTSANTLDEIAFMQFALAGAGTFNENILNQLYDARDRMSPTGNSLLAFTLNKFNAADTRWRDLLSNLEASAVVSSSGAHWEAGDGSFFTRGSTIYTTSTVVYTLAQIDAGSTILPNAVRYLAAHRNVDRMWNFGHDNAWAIVALNAAMVGMGEIRADFAFDATLNGGPLTSGDVAGIQVTPVTATVPLEFLSPNSPNLLTIHREDGLGRLYYNTILRLNRPVGDVKPLDQGMHIERVYCDSTSGGTQAKSKDCPPLSSFKIDPEKFVTAQLTMTLPHDAYYVMVEDYIPAGTEILDQNLKTSQQFPDATGVQVQFDETDPFAEGWGWWLFNPPQIRDDRILFTADYLPAGTYVLTYTLTPLQAGEYRVLPAHAWQAFFPEVQGTSAGTVIEIKP